MEKPSVSHTKFETYDFAFDGRTFSVNYTQNALEREGKLMPIDENVRLNESFVNKYKSPGTNRYSVKQEAMREVMRELSTGQNYVQIDQWHDIPAGLESLLDNLPGHVRTLLRTEYSDPGVMPYDFGFGSS